MTRDLDFSFTTNPASEVIFNIWKVPLIKSGSFLLSRKMFIENPETGECLFTFNLKIPKEISLDEIIESGTFHQDVLLNRSLMKGGDLKENYKIDAYFRAKKYKKEFVLTLPSLVIPTEAFG